MRRAAAAGVGVQSLEDFAVESEQRGLVLGFGAIESDRIESGLKILARLLVDDGSSP